MSKTDFVTKNLINYYKSEFLSIWELKDNENIDKIAVILREFENDKSLCCTVVKSYLNSLDLFTNFVGAYLSFAFGIEYSASVLIFKNIMRLYKNSPPNTVEGRLYFYTQTLTDILNEQGFIIAFEGQKNTFTVPLTLINDLQNMQ